MWCVLITGHKYMKCFPATYIMLVLTLLERVAFSKQNMNAVAQGRVEVIPTCGRAHAGAGAFPGPSRFRVRWWRVLPLKRQRKTAELLRALPGDLQRGASRQGSPLPWISPHRAAVTTGSMVGKSSNEVRVLLAWTSWFCQAAHKSLPPFSGV
jgi:hypothetical protein